MIIKFKIFEEVRFSDYLDDNQLSNLSYSINNEFNEKDLIKFITFNIYENGKKLHYNIKWNHKKEHDILNKMVERTNMKNSKEFKDLIKKILNELFLKYYKTEISKNGTYSIWLSEYDLSYIIKIDHINKILLFITLLNGCRTYDVINVIEIKSTI